jgi:type I restriction enzyme S subunit
LPIIRIQNLNGAGAFNYFDGAPDPKWIVEPGDLLFAWAGVKGVSFGPTIWNGPRGVLNQHIYRIEPKTGLSKRWLYYALSEVTTEIESKAHGFKTNLVHVRKADITGSAVSVPAEPEQRAMAATLMSWDAAIDKTERLIAAKERRVTALMIQLGVRRSRVNKTWLHAPLHQVADRVQRLSDGDGYPLLTISSASGFVRQQDKYNRYMAGESAKTYTLLRRGEFAYNKGNSLRYEFGCVFPLADYDAALVPSVYVSFRLRDGVSAAYMRHLFATDYLKPQLRALVKTGVRNNGLLNIRPDEFMGTSIPLPPLAEQERIATILDSARDEIRLLGMKLDALRQQKRGLMRKLLTGEWRVPVDEEEAA